MVINPLRVLLTLSTALVLSEAGLESSFLSLGVWKGHLRGGEL